MSETKGSVADMEYPRRHYTVNLWQPVFTYLSSKYHVFDKYGRGSSTKDHKHERRLRKSTGSPDLCVKKIYSSTQ